MSISIVERKTIIFYFINYLTQDPIFEIYISLEIQNSKIITQKISDYLIEWKAGIKNSRN